jgi:hypothetical protein
MNSTRKTMNALGYAGLIPFVIPAILIATNSTYSPLLTSIVNAYGFGIICFLTGAWWGVGLTTDSTRTLILSNMFFLVAFFGYISQSIWWALVAALLLMSIFFVEHYTTAMPATRKYYRKMRGTLSLVASASMLTIYVSTVLR